MRTLLLLLFSSFCVINCSNHEDKKEKSTDVTKMYRFDFNLDEAIENCVLQLDRSIPKLVDLEKHPRLIKTEETEWTEVTNNRLVWTSGFYPGILWYMYGLTGETKWKEEAVKRTEVLEKFKTIDEHHDIGFIMFSSFGNGYSIGNKSSYKDILLESAESLSSRFNAKVGTIRSWSNYMHPRWKQHITIIDNMVNLELLLWAAKNGGDKELETIAITHANTTMKNHYREDGTSWHVLEYDSISGDVLNRHTKQGLHDDSRWSRGQAWGIYGYTMLYRETGDQRFLDFTQKIADSYLSLLPDDYIPYWDFDIDTTIDQDRDSSAAAIVASALLELSTLVQNEELQHRYFDAAVKMLESLSSSAYSGVDKTDSLLLHSTGAKSLGHEIDVALIYADYYYVEALYRLKQIVKTRPSA